MLKRRFKRLLLACPGFETLCRLLTRGHVRALMYHRFSAGASADGRTVGADTLREQVDYLARHHEFWYPDDHLDAIAGRRARGRCPVVITADDGYHDFYDVAFPILRERGVPATLFVTTGFVDGRTWFWWDRLACLLAAADGWRGDVDLGQRTFAVDLTNGPSRTRAWHRLADRCRFLPNVEKEELLRRLATVLGVAPHERPPAEYGPVTWDQVREMAAAGIRFGAHTVSHPILTRLSRHEAADEIAESRRRLEEMTGAPVTCFCYPQGGPADEDESVRELVRSAGLGMSYLAYQIMSQPTDPYAMPRYCVQPDPVEFRWTLCGAEWLFLRLRRRLGRPARPGGDAYWSGAG